MRVEGRGYLLQTIGTEIIVIFEEIAVVKRGEGEKEYHGA
jgi:hypothetical protein